MNIFVVRCAVLGYIINRWSSVVACWLNWFGFGFGLGLGLGQGTGNALAVIFFVWSYKCSEHLANALSNNDDSRVLIMQLWPRFPQSKRVG